MPVGSQLTVLINAEIDAKTLAFDEAATRVQRHLDQMRTTPGRPVVIDSNVLLQCQRLDYLDWSGHVGEPVRVMIPLRVVEEVDSKKYGDSKRLRAIARSLTPWIDGLFSTGQPEPVRLREGATIELLLADRPRFRPQDGDEEILDIAHDVRDFAGRVSLLTADTGMRVRAQSEGLDVIAVPEAWRRQNGPPDD